MKVLNVSNYKQNPHGIYYMDLYHPYHHGSNPNFNDFSSKILSLKNGQPLGIKYFHDLLVEKGLYDSDFTIITVPPSDPAKDSTHGTKLLINSIFKNTSIKKVKNGTDCLVRTKKVEKSVNGNRSATKHLQSITVRNKELIKSRTVLLVDDVTTTGNSLIACTGILQNCKYDKIVLLALAQTA